MEMDFRMIAHKFQRWIQFFRVDQGYQRQDCRKRRSGKHEFHHTQVAVTLEHPTLELARKAIEKKKQE